MMTDMMTNSPNIPILSPSVSWNLCGEREGCYVMHRNGVVVV